MPITAKNTDGEDFEKVPPGAYFAICILVVDLGLQMNQRYQRALHKVYIGFELPDEVAEYEKDGRKHKRVQTLGSIYTLSLSKKAILRKDLENWRGVAFTPAELEGFDLTKLLGKCCQVMVKHDNKDGKTFINLAGIMGLSKDQKERGRTARPSNQLISCEGEDDENYDLIPQWLRNKIRDRVIEEQPVARGIEQLNKPTHDFDDDIPF